MNILLVKKYYLLIKNKQQNKLNLALEKQIKNIEYQGEKQVKVIQNQGKIKTAESNKNVGNQSSKIFDELLLKKLVK